MLSAAFDAKRKNIILHIFYTDVHIWLHIFIMIVFFDRFDVKPIPK